MDLWMYLYCLLALYTSESLCGLISAVLPHMSDCPKVLNLCSNNLSLSLYLSEICRLSFERFQAFNPRHEPVSTAEFRLDNTESNISQIDLKKSYLELRRSKTVEEEIGEKMARLNARKSPHLKPDSTWWPSRVNYSKASNEIPDSSSESGDRERVTQRPATFEELENRNANIHNPLLNLDHYPNPLKKYSFVELENMNANQYNPYLN